MTRPRKVSAVLILAGICFPLFLFFFVSNYDPQTSLSWNLNRMEIVFKEQRWVRPSGLDEALDHLYFVLMRERAYLRFGGLILKPRISIHYKYVILFGIISISIGTGLIATAGRNVENNKTLYRHRGTKA
ncbi:MAG TPA: hypothetical protein PLX02_01885 [Syntrophorhabdaceae bacterium]|nr:hypothetical protein [Syntrophorhabdaceae bacterium]HQM80349.1 hypothetical protein [Syntrophorhabdaceae bacterium]